MLIPVLISSSDMIGSLASGVRTLQTPLRLRWWLKLYAVYQCRPSAAFSVLNDSMCVMRFSTSVKHPPMAAASRIYMGAVLSLCFPAASCPADDIEVLQPVLLASLQAQPHRRVLHQPGRAPVHQPGSSGMSAAIAQVCSETFGNIK